MPSDSSVNLSAETLAHIVNSIPDPSFILTKKGEIQTVNDYAVSILEYDQNDLIGAPFEKVLTEATGSFSVENFLDGLRDGEHRAGESTLRTRTDEVIPVVFNVSSLPTVNGINESFLLTAKEVYEFEEANERLRVSERNYRELFENSGEALFVHDPETAAILDVNRKMCQLYGYSRREATELTIEDISLGRSPFSMQEARKYLDRALRGVPQTFEWVARRKNDQLFWVEVRLKRVKLDGKDRVLASVRDIDERKKAEKEREKLSQFPRFFPGPLLRFNSSGEITFTNDYFRSHDLAVNGNKVLADVFPPFQEMNPETIIQDSRTETFVHTLGKTVYQFFVNGISELEFGQLYGLDITERTEAEARLRNLTSKLQKSNDELKQFANVVAHDLKQPLRTIVSYLDLLTRRHGKDLADTAVDYVNTVRSASRRMKNLLDGLLRYSKVSEDSAEFQTVDLNDTLRRVRENLSVAINKHDATLKTVDLPQVVGDPSLLEQLFQNLVENAIDYRGDHPPRIRVEHTTEKSYEVISVKDNGIGIQPGYQQKIFNVFEQLQPEQDADSIGIGLSICQKIADLHDGSITVDSEPGSGSSFNVFLPRKKNQ